MALLTFFPLGLIKKNNIFFFKSIAIFIICRGENVNICLILAKKVARAYLSGCSESATCPKDI